MSKNIKIAIAVVAAIFAVMIVIVFIGAFSVLGTDVSSKFETIQSSVEPHGHRP